MTKQELISFTEWLDDNYGIGIPDMVLQEWIKYHTEEDKSAFKLGDKVKIVRNTNSGGVKKMNGLIGEVGEVTNMALNSYKVLDWYWDAEDLELIERKQ